MSDTLIPGCISGAFKEVWEIFFNTYFGNKGIAFLQKLIQKCFQHNLSSCYKVVLL